MKRKKGSGIGLGQVLKQEGQRAAHSDNPSPPQGYARRLWHKTLEGDWVTADAPTHEELLRHAEKFGTEQVAETMVELGYGLEALTSSIERLDQIARFRRERDESGRAIKSRVSKKQSAEQRAKKLLNWEDPEIIAAREAEEALAVA